MKENYNITEMKHREEELQKLLEALEQRYEIISALGTAYEEICQVDLLKQTYMVVSGEFEGQVGPLEELKTLFIDKNISKEYQEEAKMFIDFSTVGVRLAHQKFVSHEFKSKSGKWFLISFIVKKRSENGEITHILMTARDVNEQKEKELEQQRLTKMRLQTIAEAIHGGFRICKFDSQCTFIMVSEQLAHMLGYESPMELIKSSGGSMEGIVNYEDSVREMNQALYSIAAGQMYTMHYRIRCKNGRWKNIEDRGRLIRNKVGEDEIWSFIVDQDELVKKTQALENAKNINKTLEKKQIWTDDYYKNLLDMVNCGVVCYSIPGHQILHMNAEALRIYGVHSIKEAQSVMGEVLRNVTYLDPTISRRLKELSTKDGSIDYECIITNLERKSFNIMAQTEVVSSFKEERLIITTFLDISENQTLKNEKKLLERLAREAKLANESKTNFLRRMSHDIRTPLNGIMGLLEINETHFDDLELVKENHKKMKTAANYLLSLIDDILQTSKLEDGKVVLSHEVIDLVEMSKDIINIISVRAVEAGVKCNYNSKKIDIPHPYIYGSPVHLRQIFLNIYGNCIKYNRRNGEINTTVECLENNEKVCRYRWTISDTGIGMSEEFLEHIFEPFVQESTQVKSSYQGVGLGMSIVKGLLDQMGGSIKITSKEGVGSTFEITIPFDIAPAPSNLPKHTLEVEEDIHGIHLMLVEDNALNAEIAQALLTDQGAKISVATNGQKAVEMFCSNPPDTFDVILMDMMMPVMDGLTATKAIRALERIDAKTIPIIAMTANAFKEDEEKCLEAGMNAHLAKPLDVTMVKKMICEQIRKK